ncbi:Hypothetical protein NCS54_01329800 [Fusarium falciforme]|uniref:Hypothetical protein n=1 Tax=Fusarium falciforme TaxID=195108 RepID=UPI00230076A2|nr:Hypothetical protein NCS54_01329800 [Fusarium falciforme]WAO95664.1 Hypothetical protein NCS54_01329800 [Fusarium falciforme]
MNTQDSKDERRYVSPPVTGKREDMQGGIGEVAKPGSCSNVKSIESSSVQVDEPEPSTCSESAFARSSGRSNSVKYTNSNEYRAQTYGTQLLGTGITPVGGSAGDGKHAERPFGQSPASLRPNTIETISYGSHSYVTITSSAYTKLASENSRCKASIYRLQEELWREKARVRKLEEEVRDQEHVIAKVHSNAISLLSSNVSSDLPDDKIRRGLSNLLDGIARDWCLDLHATDDIDESGAATVLMSNNILADASDLPAHLRINMRDETAAPVLLQAALAKSLCDSFLMEPFFLQDWLPRASDAAFKGTNLHAITTWRVQTVEYLEVVFPPSKDYFRERADGFVREYSCLLRQVHEDALSELSELMEQFFKLALQLWKRHVLISVEGLEEQDLKHFRSGQPDMEAEDSVLNGARGAHLDGRPVQVMVRP